MTGQPSTQADSATEIQAKRLASVATLARPVQHDINNLLTVIFANLEMLKRTAAEGAPQRQLDRVAEAARRGDAVASELWDETIRYLALGVGNIITVLAPEAVILGGGVAAAGEQLLDPLRRRVREFVKIAPVELIRIAQAELGGDSGVYGALILGRQALAAHPPGAGAASSNA